MRHHKRSLAIIILSIDIDSVRFEKFNAFGMFEIENRRSAQLVFNVDIRAFGQNEFKQLNLIIDKLFAPFFICIIGRRISDRCILVFGQSFKKDILAFFIANIDFGALINQISSFVCRTRRCPIDTGSHNRRQSLFVLCIDIRAVL